MNEKAISEQQKILIIVSNYIHAFEIAAHMAIVHVFVFMNYDVRLKFCDILPLMSVLYFIFFHWVNYMYLLGMLQTRILCFAQEDYYQFPFDFHFPP